MALILGIESSCDETAAAIVRDGYEVIGDVVASQVAKHAVHGGVVPELAAREHLTALPVVINETFKSANLTINDIDAIAVTQGPGLIPALLVGNSFAKGLAMANNKKLIGANHFLAHIYGAFLEDSNKELENIANYPLLALVVSGGHTSLLLINSNGEAKQLGCTIDDAAGEALDKGAKLLNLGYPGGPIVQKTAESGNPNKFYFPRPLTGSAGKALSAENKYNFSFSGIKTALLYHTKRELEKGNKFEGELLFDTVASYQEAIVDVLVHKTMIAAKEYNVKMLVACGGVACNSVLRSRLEEKTPKNIKLVLAQRKYCTDNAAMVAGIGFHYWRNAQFADAKMDAFARLPEISTIPFLKGEK